MLILVTGICFFSSSWPPFSPQFDNMEKERALEAWTWGLEPFLACGTLSKSFNHWVAVFSLKGHGTTYLQKILENKALTQSHARHGSLVEVSHVLGEVVFNFLIFYFLYCSSGISSWLTNEHHPEPPCLSSLRNPNSVRNDGHSGILETLGRPSKRIPGWWQVTAWKENLTLEVDLGECSQKRVWQWREVPWKRGLLSGQEFVLASTICGKSLKIVKWGNDIRLRKTRWEFSSYL